MADILDAAQTTNPVADPTAPVPPPPPPPEPPPTPPPAPVTDNLVVPPPEEVITPEPPKEDKPKKKSVKPAILIASLLVMLITIPIMVFGVKNTLNLFGFACDEEASGYCAKINANQQKKAAANNPPPVITASPGNDNDMKAGAFGYNYDTQKATTASEWQDHTANIAGTYVLGTGANAKRYVINLPDTQNAAIAYGLSRPHILDTAISDPSRPGKYIDFPTTPGTSGQTWAPPGTGCDPTTNPDSTACLKWHWTTCTNAGTGVNGVGCDVTTKKTSGGGGNNPPGSPPQCVSLIPFKGSTPLTSSDLAALHPGDQIGFAYAPGGSVTKVRFRVAAGSTPGAWNEVTSKTPVAGTDYYVWLYTLENTTNFSVEAQWFDGTGWH